jgi:hypothetical protein
MIKPSLTLLLPAIDSPDGEWPEMPALQTLISKGDRKPLQETFNATLCDHFGLPAADGSELPLAALSALGDGLDAGDGWWLRADPVHLVADRDQLFLSASDALGISQDEADVLLAELNRVYADDGWQFIAATPQRWYLRLPQPMAIRTTPTGEAMGRRVGEVLPQGTDAMAWQRVMTEVQMLLHTSPVNVARSEQGVLAVNGIWFWGGGPHPKVCEGVDWQYVVTDNPVAQGLAQLHELPLERTLLDSAEGSAIWIGGEVQQGLPGLEQNVFAPLLARLQSGSLAQLVIELPGQGRWQIERKALRRWWRRRKPLTVLLKGA